MRIRTIKPEFFTHEGIFEAEQETGLPLRIAFQGLWCAADREGRFRWEPRRLGVAILPYDGIDFSRVLEALLARKFIIRYGDSGEYGAIPSFHRHQCVNLREAKSNIPSPPEGAMKTEMPAACTSVEYWGVNVQPALRDTVLARDGHKCVRCGTSEDLTVDHIFPRSIGGTHALKNLRTLCRKCNSARPVQGAGLIADLARDGLTLDDMHSTCVHVHARGEGKGKEGKGKDSSCPDSAAPTLDLDGLGASPKDPHPNPEAEAFVDWFLALLAETGAPVPKLTASSRHGWADAFDKLIRIDGKTADQVHRVCRWARNDSFWRGNFMSPVKLRDKRDGVSYCDFFLNKMGTSASGIRKPYVPAGLLPE